MGLWFGSIAEDDVKRRWKRLNWKTKRRNKIVWRNRNFCSRVSFGGWSWFDGYWSLIYKKRWWQLWENVIIGLELMTVPTFLAFVEVFLAPFVGMKMSMSIKFSFVSNFRCFSHWYCWTELHWSQTFCNSAWCQLHFVDPSIDKLCRALKNGKLLRSKNN